MSQKYRHLVQSADLEGLSLLLQVAADHGYEIEVIDVRDFVTHQLKPSRFFFFISEGLLTADVEVGQALLAAGAIEIKLNCEEFVLAVDSSRYNPQGKRLAGPSLN